MLLDGSSQMVAFLYGDEAVHVLGVECWFQSVPLGNSHMLIVEYCQRKERLECCMIRRLDVACETCQDDTWL